MNKPDVNKYCEFITTETGLEGISYQVTEHVISTKIGINSLVVGSAIICVTEQVYKPSESPDHQFILKGVEVELFEGTMTKDVIDVKALEDFLKSIIKDSLPNLEKTSLVKDEKYYFWVNDSDPY